MNSNRLHILIVGCGGREHAIVRALAKSSLNPRLFCFGTYRNPGIFSLVSAYGTSDKLTDVKCITKFASETNIDIAIIGGESSLEAGIVDMLTENGVFCIGPTKLLARLETSKMYTRNLLHKYGLMNVNPRWKSWDCSIVNGMPTYEKDTPRNKITTEAHYNQLKTRNFNSSIEQEIRQYMNDLDGQFVIKCDGLKGGKGVFVCGDHFKGIEEGLNICKNLYDKRESFLIEEKLQGEEFSLISMCDGTNFIHFPIVKDYKRAENDERGANTGGMGTITCKDHKMPFLSESDVAQAQLINEKTIRALTAENRESYIGFVYGGFMKLEHLDVNGNGIKVIEYNVRLGDPEAINLLELFDSTTDFGELCLDLMNGTLNKSKVKFKKTDSKCIYIVPKGYPNNTVKDYVIDKTMLSELTKDYEHLNLIVSGVNHKRISQAHSGNVYIEHIKTTENGAISYETVDVKQVNKTVYQTPISVTDNIELQEIIIDSDTTNTTNHKPSLTSQSSQQTHDRPPPPSQTNSNNLVTTGSRTFALIGVGSVGIKQLHETLNRLKSRSYMNNFTFRTDIGKNIIKESPSPSPQPQSQRSKGIYANSGVDIDKSNDAVKSIQHFVKTTHNNLVIPNDGGFGGIIKFPSDETNSGNPFVMINSTDSVGSKSIFVREWWGKTKGMRSLGHDIVNHCINDILVQSPDVQPWTFLDYYATHTLNPVELRWFVQGVSEACKNVGCVLIGGETAEIPGIYRERCHDLVGAITGYAKSNTILNPKQNINPGDAVIGIPSVSPHTNGFTLIQHLIKQYKSSSEQDHSYLRYVDDLAKPHKCYLNDIRTIKNAKINIKGLCHITGGGFIDNPKRILRDNIDIKFDWELIKKEMPEWMKWLHTAMKKCDPDFTEKEMFRTFNCGFGMLVVVAPDDIARLLSLDITGLKIVGKVIEK